MDSSETVMSVMGAFGSNKRNQVKIRLTKLNHVEKATRRSPPIKIGFSVEGVRHRPLQVGQSFYVGTEWWTSVVQEILTETKNGATFRTQNSIYKVEEI